MIERTINENLKSCINLLQCANNTCEIQFQEVFLMFAKRMLALMLAAVCLFALGSPARASDGGQENDVFLPQVDCDSVYCFSGEEFGENLTGVCILSLPAGNTGTVLLGQRVVRPGDILPASQLSMLTFRPLPTENDTQALVTYLPIYENRVERQATMTISIRGKQDKAPVAEDAVLETYKNLPNGARLKASDPEGGLLTYTLVRGPRRGEVTIAEDGTFTYAPKKNKIGTDSFTYTATDAAGNVSREATVTIQILKPADKTFYADTFGKECRFAAEWLKNKGLFQGETLADQRCFQPEKAVSRGEFVAMLVQTLGLPVREDVTCTGFADDCPAWLRPYLAAAQRAGLMENWPGGSEFGANGDISAREAALLAQNALQLPASVLAGDQEVADRAVTVMAENGVELPGDGPLTRAHVAMALYRISKLIPTAPGMQVVR
jgi:hypothetical protein